MRPRVRIGGGIIFFAVFLLLGGYRYTDLTLLFAWLLAALLHELGHFAAALGRGAEIERLTVDMFGARMSLGGKLLSYKDEAIIAAGGPLVNIFIFVASYSFFKELSAFSLALGLLNLVPAPGFDGYRILFSLIAHRFGCASAEKTAGIFSFSAILFLWLAGTYTLLRYRSGFSLFILSLALMCGAMKKRG